MLNPWGLLESERDAGRLLNMCLASLKLQAHKFGTALVLADYCDEQRAPHRAVISEPSQLGNMDHIAARMRAMGASRQFVEWKQLAADAGAIALYNFAELIQTIDGLIGMCPTAKEHMDNKLMKEGRSLFKTTFPGYADIRFGVAHAGKPFASPEVFERQRLPGSNVMVVGHLTDRTLFSTVNGKAVDYSLVKPAHDALVRAAELTWEALEPAGQFTGLYDSARQRETPAPPSQGPDRPQ